jgi:hypothetical protein
MATEIKQQSKERTRQGLLEQSRALLPVMFVMYAPVLILFAIIGLQTRIPVENLTRDPLAITRAPFYIGAISNIGILFWCSAVAICFFSFRLLRDIGRNKEFQRFFLFSGDLTSILLLDDLFLLHEEVFPYYLNIPEKLVFVGYGMIISLYLVKFRKIILKTEFLFFLLAFGFLGLSVIIDLLPIPTRLLGNQGEFLLEDGFKLMGIISWFTYFARVGVTQLKRAIAPNYPILSEQ